MDVIHNHRYSLQVIRQAFANPIIATGTEDQFITAEFERKEKPAAVLMPLIAVDGSCHFLFTRRTELVAEHRGQVSFPGGAWEAGDGDLTQTAKRETWEELGISTNQVEVLGSLQPRSLISGYRVTPVIGYIQAPLRLQVHPQEVARAFSIPLEWLAEPQNRYLETRRINGNDYEVIFYQPYQGEVLWGATAGMVVDFLQAVEENLSK